VYRSRSLSPPTRRGSCSDPGKNKKAKIKETIKPLAAGAAGFIAGGFIGHTAGKEDMMSTVAGVVFGTIGVSEVEREWERRRKRRGKDKGRTRY